MCFESKQYSVEKVHIWSLLLTLININQSIKLFLESGFLLPRVGDFTGLSDMSSSKVTYPLTIVLRVSTSKYCLKSDASKKMQIAVFTVSLKPSLRFLVHLACRYLCNKPYNH